MPFETDLARIWKLAHERNDENWAFRAFLKQTDIPWRRVDRLVHELFRDLAARIDCTQCGNCCRVMSPVLKPVDVQRLAARLGLTPDAFQAQYLKEDPDGEGWAWRALPCSFLRDNHCAVYEDRPQVCRSYPHLQKREFVCRSIRVIENCAVCPIVFNVYEGLKDALWRHAPEPD